MLGSRLHNEMLTVQQVSTGAPDDDGVPAQTITDRAWGPCIVQQLATTEQRGTTATTVREVVTTRLKVSGPLAHWIDENDKVLRDGRPFRVEGEPAHFVSGVMDHTELVLIAWKGE